MKSYRQRWNSALRASAGSSPTPAEQKEADRKYDVVNSNIKLNKEGTKHPTREQGK